MFDSKVVRRRRAALAIFVVLSMVMLTASFGESGGGLFGALQRGAQEAFAPLETGAGKALKPFRDLFGWFGDSFDAKDENKSLKRRGRGPAQAARPLGHRRARRGAAARPGQALARNRLPRRPPARWRRG